MVHLILDFKEKNPKAIIRIKGDQIGSRMDILSGYVEEFRSCIELGERGARDGSFFFDHIV